MKKIAVVIAILGLAFIVYYRAHQRAPKRTAGGTAKSPAAPALTMTDLNGNQIDTSSYAGSVVLVNFWAAWCTPCAEEVPQLVSLQDKYRGQGLHIVGISMDDQDSVLRDFYRKNNMNYPVVAGSQKIAEAYGGILGLPTSILINRQGRISAQHSGLVDLPQLEQEVVALLRSAP